MAQLPYDTLEEFISFIDNRTIPTFETAPPSLTAGIFLERGSIDGIATACGRDIQEMTYADLKYSTRNNPMFEKAWDKIRARMNDTITNASRFSWAVLGMPIWDGLLLRSAIQKGQFVEYPKMNMLLESPIPKHEGGTEQWGYVRRSALIIAIGQGNFDSPNYPNYVMQNFDTCLARFCIT